MLHIATVHWKDERWIDVQLRYLSKHITLPFQVYAFVNEIENNHSHKFFYCSTEPIVEHPIKLNLLSDIIKYSSRDDDDLLIFIDGDAFPIGDVVSLIHNKIETHKLLAIQRRENNGDIQPHPSFCATTVGFWKAIKGDWKQGHRWRNEQGDLVTDVGGNMLKICEEKRINWYPLLRSNKKDLHPLWFGVYDDVIYHHGAGFRNAISRLDFELYNVNGLKKRLIARLLDRLPYRLNFFQRIKARLHPVERMEQEIIRKNNALSDLVFAKLVKDENFYREFI